MIIVFPMLVSQSVSENAIPGIAKTMEIYLITNHMSDIMDDPQIKKSGLMRGFTSVGKKWIAKEETNILEISDKERDEYVGTGGTKDKNQTKAEIDEIRRKKEEVQLAKSIEDLKAAEIRTKAEQIRAQKELENLKGTIAKNKNSRDVENLKSKQNEVDQLKDKRDELQKQRDDLIAKKKERQKEREEQRKREEEQLKKDETKATTKVTTTDYKSISLEPSYITVETMLVSGAIRRDFVGIKVVPYRVKSTVKLSRLILHDVQLNFLNAALVTFGRKTIRWFYRLVDKWTGRLKQGGLSASGDPRRDVIMARTGHQGLGIIVLNRHEDVDERFVQNISKINRLFSMGWGNIIVADDISRQAYFCTHAFKGLCNVVNYAMMYQRLGQLQVYDSLEDAKRQNSSLFKISKKGSRVLGEWNTQEKLDKYCCIREDK